MVLGQKEKGRPSNPQTQHRWSQVFHMTLANLSAARQNTALWMKSYMTFKLTLFAFLINVPGPIMLMI